MTSLYPRWDPYGTAVYREPVRRSWLIVPALDDRLLGQATGCGADVIVVDLEDGVHESKKPLARARFPSVLEPLVASGAEVFIRIGLDYLYADIAAALWPGVVGLVLPKVASAAEVREADELVAEWEQRRGLPEVPEVHLCLETAAGNQHAAEIIKASPRVRSVSLGRADLVMDLRPDPAGNLVLMPYLLQRLALIARACEVEPIGAWWAGDSRGMLASPEATLLAAQRARRSGFAGGLCVDPSQVAPLNRGFSPSAAEVAWARAASQADGETGQRALAPRLLERAHQCEARDGRTALASGLGRHDS